MLLMLLMLLLLLLLLLPEPELVPPMQQALIPYYPEQLARVGSQARLDCACFPPLYILISTLQPRCVASQVFATASPMNEIRSLSLPT